jgi:hypothetical protein
VKQSKQNRTWVLSAALTVGLFCIGSSFYTSLFWPFLPLSFALVSILHKRLSFGLLGISLFGHLLLAVLGKHSWHSVELFALIIFHAGAFLILRFPKSFRPWPRIIGAGLLVFMLGFSFLIYSDGFSQVGETWNSLSQSPLIPRSFQEELWPEAQKEMYQTAILPIALSGAAALLSIHLMHWILYALVIWQIVMALGSSQIFARRRFWLELGAWKLSEWILVPLVVSMALLVWKLDSVLSQPFDPFVMIGWNLLILSLFAVLLRGLSIVAYLIPRLSPILVMLVLVGLIFMGPPLLIIAGFGDIWFDFRRRIRSNPFSGTGSDEDEER